VSTGSLERTLKELQRLPSVGMKDATKAVERIAREVSSSVGPVTLGKKGRRVKLRAITRGVKGSARSAEATVYGVPTGPWVWVTSGTGRHVIPKKSVRQAANRQVRFIKGDRYAHPYGKQVVHPGASGKGAWRKVVLRAERDVHEAFVDAARKAMR
jgi:hypothetical protein